MTNYEAVMSQMTPEIMAEKNVRLVTVDNRQLFYLTSSGQLFTTNDFQAAVQHEYQWLMFDPENVEKTNADVNPKCVGCETECADCESEPHE